MKNFLRQIFLLLMAGMLTVSACAAEFPADGRYTIEVALSGGSGKAKVESPAELTVSEGTMSARIVWSSPNYNWMLLGGEYYYRVNTEGNSAFEIPVPALDEDIAFSAETTAMSQARVIDYTLRFDSNTLKSLDGGAGSAMEMLPYAAAGLAVIAIAAILVVVARKRAGGSKT